MGEQPVPVDRLRRQLVRVRPFRPPSQPLSRVGPDSPNPGMPGTTTWNASA
jgi:hypothetical protein